MFSTLLSDIPSVVLSPAPASCSPRRTNVISYAFTFGNAFTGIYFGCSGNGPASMCGSSASAKDTILGATTGDNGVSFPQAYGVAADASDLKNTLTGIGANGDATFDLLDNNANCGTNVWAMAYVGNGTTSRPSCIATTP